MTTKRSDYFYAFPESLIALRPLADRSASRLMVLNRTGDSLTHKKFSDIVDSFVPGDVLVMNDSKVFPCRLITTRKSGGRQEIFLIREVDPSNQTWEVLLNANLKVKAGDQFNFDGLRVTMTNDAQPDNATRVAKLEFDGDLFPLLQKIAHIPLPPYITRPDTPEDITTYQTVYAKNTGSVAAPTAGFHFTQDLLDTLRSKGVIITTVTLHVGPGTFLPVRTENIQDHKMHTEFYSLSADTCHIINEAKKQNRRVSAVGTTSVRVLESAAANKTALTPHNGQTAIFIYPPYNFKIVDRLITNFHQPESTLLMLVSAFAGRKKILAAYQEAISLGYRLFSYGDALLIE